MYIRTYIHVLYVHTCALIRIYACTYARTYVHVCIALYTYPCTTCTYVRTHTTHTFTCTSPLPTNVQRWMYRTVEQSWNRGCIHDDQTAWHFRPKHGHAPVNSTWTSPGQPRIMLLSKQHITELMLIWSFLWYELCGVHKGNDEPQNRTVWPFCLANSHKVLGHHS